MPENDIEVGRESPHEGPCRLTSTRGDFARSHLIPRALTSLGSKGERRVEVGIGQGVKKRYDSWFDSELCTHDGEKILAEIDTAAILVLRKHRLIWSSWEEKTELVEEFLAGNATTDPNFRVVSFQSPETLQLFFLSLLWRAAATTRVEFKDIHLPEPDLEDLRQRIVNKDPGPTQDYPVHLHQLTTLGTRHNRSPLLEEMDFQDEAGIERKVSYVRFYFDGLIANIFLFKGRTDNANHLKISVADGTDRRTLVIGHPADKSRAEENIKEMARTVSEQLRTGNPHRRRTKRKK